MQQFALSVGYAATSPKGRGFSLTPLYHKSAEKTRSLPKIMCHGPSRTPVPTICKHPYEKERNAAFFILYAFDCGIARVKGCCAARTDGKSGSNWDIRIPKQYSIWNVRWIPITAPLCANALCSDT